MNLHEKPLAIRLIILILGLALYGLGISLCLTANIGMAPWDTFHWGLAQIVGLSVGQVSILVGIIILVINFFMKEKIGIGTILNGLLIGVFMDFFLKQTWVPRGREVIGGSLIMLTGLAIIGMATYFYLGVGLGTGPRDGLMLVLARLTRWDIAMVRNSMEALVAFFGFLLGGSIGWGTVLTFLAIGPLVKLAFAIFKCDATAIPHEYLIK